jgi:hypothetical protein
MTALATMAYYRRKIFTSAGNALTLGVLPFFAAAFLSWVVWKSVAGAAVSQNWSLAGVLAVGVVLMVQARFGFKSAFFAVRRESFTPEGAS